MQFKLPTVIAVALATSILATPSLRPASFDLAERGGDGGQKGHGGAKGHQMTCENCGKTGQGGSGGKKGQGGGEKGGKNPPKGHTPGRCTPKHGSHPSLCHGGCHKVSPTKIVKACHDCKIDVKQHHGVQEVLKGALGGGAAGVGVDVDFHAAIEIDVEFEYEWELICGYLGIPVDSVTIQGDLDTTVTVGVGIDLDGWLKEIIDDGLCDVCSGSGQNSSTSSNSS